MNDEWAPPRREGRGNATTSPLLGLTDIHVHFPIRSGFIKRTLKTVKAVNGVSFDLQPGETFGLVGESGCGKTTLGRAIVGLAQLTSGEIRFHGERRMTQDASAMRGQALKNQLIFQDPYASLHPRKQVRDLLGEGLIVHHLAEGVEIDERCLSVLEKVGLGMDHLYRYPHEFSGGQRQRLALARALVVEPELLILDEPTSALDVSVQAQILNLLKSLQRELRLTYLFISHDLGVVRYMSQRIGVMYLGNVVELGRTRDIFSASQHPYTRSLLSALPSVEHGKRTRRITLEGDPPTPIDPPPGCLFAGRCPKAEPRCRVERPELTARGREPTHRVACHYPEL